MNPDGLKYNLMPGKPAIVRRLGMSWQLVQQLDAQRTHGGAVFDSQAEAQRIASRFNATLKP